MPADHTASRAHGAPSTVALATAPGHGCSAFAVAGIGPPIVGVLPVCALEAALFALERIDVALAGQRVEVRTLDFVVCALFAGSATLTKNRDRLERLRASFSMLHRVRVELAQYDEALVVQARELALDALRAVPAQAGAR